MSKAVHHAKFISYANFMTSFSYICHMPPHSELNIFPWLHMTSSQKNNCYHPFEVCFPPIPSGSAPPEESEIMIFSICSNGELPA